MTSQETRPPPRPPSSRRLATALRSSCCRSSRRRATCSPTAPNSSRSPRPATGPAITTWANLAEAFDVTIVAGFPESAGDEVYNSAVVVDPSGVRGVYRKAHLWDTENNVFDRGDDLPLLVDTAHGRIGVMVCYDLEFPEWVRAVALAGADLLCAPVNWPLLPRPDGERPTEMVRALAGAGTNRMPIAVCDRAGVERGGGLDRRQASSPTPTAIP